MKPKIFTKEELIQAIREIGQRGWIASHRQGNDGGVGNTLEDLLDISENNWGVMNTNNWELKAIRSNTTSLTTLFHYEPSPRQSNLVPQILLPFYGWKHKQAGKKYPETEMSFRQTLRANTFTNRGFSIEVLNAEDKIVVTFDSNAVTEAQKSWLAFVKQGVGLDELNPQPYWGFNDLAHKAGNKLKNMFYLKARRKKVAGIEYFHYNELYLLETFQPVAFFKAIAQGLVYIDFDARTGHNHGTKFRTRQNHFPEFYENVQHIFTLDSVE